MVKFNIANIPDLPSNATITAIRFSVYFLDGDTGLGASESCSLFTMSKYWNSREVTWNHATVADKWEQLDSDTKYFDNALGDTVSYPGGGDRIFPCAAAAPPATHAERWETFTITEAMKGYIKEPSAFYGIYLKPYLNNSGRWYASSEYAERDKRPKLLISYSGTGIKYAAKSIRTMPGIKIRNASDGTHIFIPLNIAFKVAIVDLKGRMRYAFDGKCREWRRVPGEKQGAGVHFIHVETEKDHFYQKYVFTQYK